MAVWPQAVPLVQAVPVHVTTAPEPPSPFQLALQRLMAGEARLQSLGWRLASVNAPYCSDTTPAVGLLLFDTYGFRDPLAVRDALGVSGDIVIGAVARGSPADQAGLQAGDEVLAIGTQAMADLPAVGPQDYRRVTDLHDLIDRELVRDGQLTIRVMGSDHTERDVRLTPQKVCASRFELSDGGKQAAAQGQRVILSQQVLSDIPDDSEAAVLVAHELAHNILHHPRHLDATGRRASAVVATEREADRLAIWLATNAGYDPDAGARLAGGWLRKQDPGLFRAPTHDGWRQRQAAFRREAEIVRQRRNGAPATLLDWTTHFTL